MSETINTQPESQVGDKDLAYDMAHAMAPDMNKAIFHKNEADEIQAETDELREEMGEHDPYAQSGGHLDQEWVGDAQAEGHRQDAEFHKREANLVAQELQEDREVEARDEAHRAIERAKDLATH